MIKLNIGWEEELIKQHNTHRKGCKCWGCKNLKKTVRKRIKELNRLIIEGRVTIKD